MKEILEIAWNASASAVLATVNQALLGVLIGIIIIGVIFYFFVWRNS